MSEEESYEERIELVFISFFDTLATLRMFGRMPSFRSKQEISLGRSVEMFMHGVLDVYFDILAYTCEPERGGSGSL